MKRLLQFTFLALFAFSPLSAMATGTVTRSLTPPLPIGSGGTGQTSGQAGAYALDVPYVVHQNGATVTNTGIGTSEVNLISASFPAMGANDSLRITTLWNTSGTATDTKNLLVRLSTTSCTSLSACSSGSAVLNLTMNSSSLVSAATITIVRNANATNAQNGFTGANVTGLGSASSGIATTAIQTNAGGFINIDCTTATSSADSCALAGYTIELLPGN